MVGEKPNLQPQSSLTTTYLDGTRQTSAPPVRYEGLVYLMSRSVDGTAHMVVASWDVEPDVKPIPGGCKLVEHLYVRDSVCVDRCGTLHNLSGHVFLFKSRMTMLPALSSEIFRRFEIFSFFRRQKFFFVGSLLAQISALLLSALSIYNKQQCTTT